MTEPIYVKALAPVTKALEDESSPYGSFDVVLSTPDFDRDGEEVKSDEWETPLPEHIPFDIDHGMSVASTVGSGSPTIDDEGQLVVRGNWASTDLAQQTRTLVNEGHIRNVSVAFLRKYMPDEDDGEIVRRELLNGAFVAVPANPKAVVLSSKSMSEIQAEHDASVKAGAHCETVPAEPENFEGSESAPEAASSPAPEGTGEETASGTEERAVEKEAAAAMAAVYSARRVAY